ncbi:MAG: hypothetical protein ACRC1K_18595 [Planctomycetia bacterium]
MYGDVRPRLDALFAEPGAKIQIDLGWAFFADEAAWKAQDELFDEIVRRLTAELSAPKAGEFAFPGEDVEKHRVWRRGGDVVYVFLSFHDNTRIRRLVAGRCDVASAPRKSDGDWWSRPSW